MINTIEAGRVIRGHGRLILLSLGLLGSAGCGGQDGSSGQGSVVIDGSSTVYRISKVAQLEYAAKDDSTQVFVGNSGTSGGFEKYLQNEVDIVDASRPAKPTEESKARSQGLDWIRFVVGYDGITLIVNPKNDFAKSMTVDQLARLWKPDSDVKTWKDLNPEWPDRAIKFYSPDDKSGTFEFFTEAIVGKAKSQRKDVQTSSDDNILVRGVSGDDDAIGYLGYAYFEANATKLQAVAVQKNETAAPILPSPDSILDRSYQPLARPLFIYVKKTSYRRPAVAAFVEFYVNRAADLATKAKYVAPTAEDRDANRKALEASKVVTPSA